MDNVRPVLVPLTSVVSPYTEQITSSVLDRVPGLPGAWGNLDSLGNSVSGALNPASLGQQLGGLAGSGRPGGLVGLSNLGNLPGLSNLASLVPISRP